MFPEIIITTHISSNHHMVLVLLGRLFRHALMQTESIRLLKIILTDFKNPSTPLLLFYSPWQAFLNIVYKAVCVCEKNFAQIVVNPSVHVWCGILYRDQM